jgi:hypothetical protein
MLKYNKDSTETIKKPIQISLKVIGLPSNEILYNEVISKPVALNQRDEYANAQKAARIIMPYIGGRV